MAVVDELSLLLSPIADGNPNTPTVFEQMNETNESQPVCFHLKKVSQLENDIVHLTYQVNYEENN